MLQKVSPFSAEATAIANYFYESMPGTTELHGIERYESKQLFLPHSAYKETFRCTLDWKLEELESWLLHGTDQLDEVLRVGFSSGHVNLALNKYGAGEHSHMLDELKQPPPPLSAEATAMRRSHFARTKAPAHATILIKRYIILYYIILNNNF